MGLTALRNILPTGPVDTSALSGKTVAVDADNLIWSFVTAMAGVGELPRGPDGRSQAHLLGLLSRLSLYAKWNLRSVWVFDGEQPMLKEATLAKRFERIEMARSTGDNPQMMVEVTEEDLTECKTLLSLLGIPWLDAPGESDAQCAHLVKSGACWAAVTQDWDIALFGAPRALRNLTTSPKRPPELLDLAEALQSAGLTQEQLIDVAILIGTDYNPGIHGVGPVKAVKLVKQGSGAPERMGIANAQEIRKLYTQHAVDERFRPTRGKVDDGGLARFLAERDLDASRSNGLVAWLKQAS